MLTASFNPFINCSLPKESQQKEFNCISYKQKADSVSFTSKVNIPEVSPEFLCQKVDDILGDLKKVYGYWRKKEEVSDFQWSNPTSVSSVLLSLFIKPKDVKNGCYTSDFALENLKNTFIIESIANSLKRVIMKHEGAEELLMKAEAEFNESLTKLDNFEIHQLSNKPEYLEAKKLAVDELKLVLNLEQIKMFSGDTASPHDKLGAYKGRYSIFSRFCME